MRQNVQLSIGPVLGHVTRAAVLYRGRARKGGLAS